MAVEADLEGDTSAYGDQGSIEVSPPKYMPESGVQTQLRGLLPFLHQGNM
jgi:hypothetical protein